MMKKAKFKWLDMERSKDHLRKLLEQFFFSVHWHNFCRKYTKLLQLSRDSFDLSSAKFTALKANSHLAMTQWVHLPVMNWTLPVHLEGLPNRPALTLTSNPLKELEDSSEGLQSNFIFDGISWISGPVRPTRQGQPAIKNQKMCYFYMKLSILDFIPPSNKESFTNICWKQKYKQLTN